MSKQINIEELKALIANGIRQENLHEALPEDAVNRIKDKILALSKREAASEIPSIVSELDTPTIPPGGNIDGEFPTQDQTTPPSGQFNATGDTESFFVDSGSAQSEENFNPTMGYTPELPEILKKAEPSELFVFQYNDIGESGENLSYKPLRLMDDPDVKKSMNDLWLEQGKTKAKIYVAKFEEIGEVEFNYANGTSRFTEKSALPDYAGGNEYKENPYNAPSLPQIEEPTKKELETYIKNSIDLESVVHDIVMGIVKDSLLTNTEKVSNEIPNYALGAINPNTTAINEDTSDDEEIEFKLTMNDIVENIKFEKVLLPKELCEKINTGDKTMLVRENSEVQEWKYNDKIYLIPVERISKSRGYIKS
jgi:hypothetical protein